METVDPFRLFDRVFAPPPYFHFILAPFRFIYLPSKKRRNERRAKKEESRKERMQSRILSGTEGRRRRGRSPAATVRAAAAAIRTEAFVASASKSRSCLARFSSRSFVPALKGAEAGVLARARCSAIESARNF